MIHLTEAEVEQSRELEEEFHDIPALSGEAEVQEVTRSSLESPEIPSNSSRPLPRSHNISLRSRLVHSHWSGSYITAISLVQSFPSDACASSLMP